MAVTLFGIAAIAAAFTWEELETRAMLLLGDYQAMAASVESCPGGECSERSAIEAGFEELEVERLQLIADRQTLGSCGQCIALDQAVAAITQLSSAVSATITAWDDES